jgi:MFS family permease
MSILTSKNCRLFFSGQTLSLVGSWMTQTTVLWLIYQLTSSSLYLGLISFIEQVPTFLLVPITGGLIEQGDRRKILLTTQFLLLIYSSLLAFFVFNGTISVNLLIMLSIFKGTINAFDITARQVFIADIVRNPQHLPEAIGINSLIISSSRFIGPAIAGLMINRVGIGQCFTIDAISYLIVIIALFLIKLKSQKLSKEFISPWYRFKMGINYVKENPTIRSILVLLALISFLGASYPTLTPIFAKEVFHGDSDLMGYLLAFAGLGSLTGSLYLIWHPDRRHRENLLLISTIGLGLGLIGFAQSQNFSLSLLMMFLIGSCLVIHVATSNTLLQILVNSQNRGIVMSLFTLAYIGITPFGNLLVGQLASRIGASSTLTINGVLCLISYLAFKRSH